MTDTAVAPIDTAAHGVGLTDAAASKVKSLFEQEGQYSLETRLLLNVSCRLE